MSRSNPPSNGVGEGPDPRINIRASCPLNTYIPHPRYKFQNITSLSAHAVDAKGTKRRLWIIKHIEALLSHTDALCLGETHLGALDGSYLGKYFGHTHLIFYNNLYRGRAGVITLVCKKFASGYEISQTDLGPLAKGRVLSLRFRSKLFPDNPRASFSLANVYLTSGKDHAAKFAQLNLLNQLDPLEQLFLCGDFNMVDNTEDCTSPTSYLVLTNRNLDVWTNFLEGLGLREIEQSSHTHFFITSPVSACRSSKIDRTYCTLRDDELLVVRPATFIPNTTGSEALREYKRLLSRGSSPGATFKAHIHMDHVPVGVLFTAKPGTSGKTPDVPSWIAFTPGFARAVKERWSSPGTPAERLADWKAAVRATARSFFKAQKERNLSLSNDLNFISRAITMLRACSARNQDLPWIRTLLQRSPDMSARVILAHGRYTADQLGVRLQELLASEMGKLGAELDAETHLPTLYIPGERKGLDPISRIKNVLPSTRTRLAFLKAHEDGQITHDPVKMGDIIQGYYEELWKVDEDVADEASTDAYLTDFHRTIPDHLRPKLPTADDFTEAILETNDSSPGPDGLPFSVYRAYALLDPELAQNLCELALEMAGGSPPPKGFNYARLHLIPKKTGGLIDDTRSISVTNCDNRLNATVMVSLLQPAADVLVLPDQGGFMKGRLTGKYYSALSKKQQMYILLLDFRRAFDTMSHTFILRTLHRMGFPVWVSNMVSALLTDVWVFPTLSKRTDHKIKILKGVKQGCPLSPLLFVLCLEVLLDKVRSGHGDGLFAYADDVALATAVIEAVIMALRHVRTFTRFSGLHVNQDKTKIITTRKTKERARRRLDAEDWDSIEFKFEGIYLGLPFGARTGTPEILKEAFDKFKARLHSFKGVMRCSSIHTRVLISNVFLLPLFSYLIRFVLLPYRQVVLKVKELMRKAIIPFNGGGFGYTHLIATKNCGYTLHTPLRDLWAWNVSTMAAAFPLEDSHEQPLPVLGEKQWVCHWKNGLDRTVNTEDHVAYCAFVFLHDCAPRRNNYFIDLEGLPPTSKGPARRKWIYEILVANGFDYKRERRDVKFPTSLPVKVGKATGLPPCTKAANFLGANAKLVVNRLPPAVWNTQVRLTMNALPFDLRLTQAGVNGRHGRAPASCLFCSQSVDSCAHVYGHCAVVRKARQLLAARILCSLGDDLPSVVLSFPATSQLRAMATCAFNYAVWYVRTHLIATLDCELPVEEICSKIVSLSCMTIPADKSANRGELTTKALANNPPEDMLAGYTDRSALGSPGPCGGGYVIVRKGAPLLEESIPLGIGDNNLGEMGALLGLLEALLRLHLAGGLHEKRVLVFTDSSCCVGYLERGWACPTDLETARKTRAALHKLKKVKEVNIYWIRGHSQVKWNEVADALAREGADAAKRLEDGPLGRGAQRRRPRA